jgi:diguanylate cyclase (GGDEF)-like protein/PAS domain S-box-containing protein
MIYTPFLLPLLISAMVLGSVLVYVQRYRGELTVRLFSSILGVALGLIIFQAAELVFQTLELKFFFLNLRMVLLVSMPPLILAFTLLYAGKGAALNSKLFALLAIEPVVVIILAFTGQHHSLFRYNFELVTGGPFPILVWERGPIFWLHVLYTYVLNFASVVVLLGTFGMRALYFWDTLLLVIGLGIPTIFDLFYNLGLSIIPGYNMMPASLSITGVIYTWALLRFRLFAASPVARNAIMDNLEDLVMVLDPRGKIVDFNRAAQATCGLSTRETIGDDVNSLPPEWAAIISSHYRVSVQKKEVRAGGRVYSLSTSPMSEKNGDLLGYLFIFHDISEEKRTDEKLRQLAHAVEQSPASIMITDSQGNIEYVNLRFTEVTGYSAEEALGKTPRILRTEFTPPETYPRLWDTIKSGKQWQGEFVNRKKNGELYHESATITPIFGPGGEIRHFLASKQDITAQKQAEAALIRREQEMETLYELSLEINAFSDLPALLRAIIRRACELLKVSSGAVFLLQHDENVLELVIHHNLPTHWLGAKLNIGEGLAGKIFESGAPQVVEDYQKLEQRPAAFQDSQARRVLGVPLKVRGQSIGAIILIDYVPGTFHENDIRLVTLFADQAAIAVENARLVNDLRNANEQLNTQIGQIKGLQAILREQAIRDPLTSLHNRRFLQEMMPHEIARALREKYQIGFVMIDIDHFKQVNDTYGHDAGDLVLQKLAKMLVELARASDIVCRYGGEEFLAILPNTNVDEAFQISERWRRAFENKKVNYEGHELRATISCGVALFPQNGVTEKESITAADKALYRAKNSGRNRVVVAE